MFLMRRKGEGKVTQPTRAYDLLEEFEKLCVDEYVDHTKRQQKMLNERIILALKKPICTEHLKRSRGVLHRPLVRAALHERITEEADEEDLSPTRVIRELQNIAFSNQKDYYEAGDFGELVLKNIDTISREKMAAVKTIECYPSPMGMRHKVVLHDKKDAQKMLALLMGLVAPENPPVLEDYVSRKAQEAKDEAPEEIYAKLLEG